MDGILLFLMISVIAVWSFFNAATLVSLFWDCDEMIDNFKEYRQCPRDLYDNTKLNWFGVIVAFLGLFLLFPVYYLLLGLYWLFHVGRKE